MVHTYKVTGMSCMGCKNHVQQSLQKVEGVNAVEVNLETAEARVEMQRHIPTAKLQQALSEGGSQYKIENL